MRVKRRRTGEPAQEAPCALCFKPLFPKSIPGLVFGTESLNRERITLVVKHRRPSLLPPPEAIVGPLPEGAAAIEEPPGGGRGGRAAWDRQIPKFIDR